MNLHECSISMMNSAVTQIDELVIYLSSHFWMFRNREGDTCIVFSGSAADEGRPEYTTFLGRKV
jgi:hypothetical protein